MAVSTPGRIAGSRVGFDAINTLRAQVSSRLNTFKRRHAVYRRTLDELIMLSDRELADIGIPRCHIRRVAREAASMVQANE